MQYYVSEQIASRLSRLCLSGTFFVLLYFVDTYTKFNWLDGWRFEKELMWFMYKF